MINTLAAISDMLKRVNRDLHHDDAMRKVCLRFASPIPRARVWEFFRIRIPRFLYARGEQRAFPLGKKSKCSFCQTPLDCIDGSMGVCSNPRCERFQKIEVIKAARGVIAIEIPSDQIANDMVSCAVLVLDRRYNQDVLAAVYRTAGAICDMHGWRLL